MVDVNLFIHMFGLINFILLLILKIKSEMGYQYTIQFIFTLTKIFTKI
jgi:hypothetical protein